jgi:hypothetical protein
VALRRWKCPKMWQLLAQPGEHLQSVSLPNTSQLACKPVSQCSSLHRLLRWGLQLAPRRQERLKMWQLLANPAAALGASRWL